MKILKVKCLAPTRLDNYLMQQYPALNPGRLNKALRENKIKLNGKKQPLSTRVMAGDVFVGMVGELHPHVNEALGFPAHSAAFELDLTALFATLSGKPVQAKPISTFPPVKQDLAFTVSTDVTAAELKQVIVEAAGDSLESIELFDVYTGDQLGEGEKSLAYAVTFRAPDKTLASEDSEAIRKRIVDEASKLGAQLRA